MRFIKMLTIFLLILIGSITILGIYFCYLAQSKNLDSSDDSSKWFSDNGWYPENIIGQDKFLKRKTFLLSCKDTFSVWLKRNNKKDNEPVEYIPTDLLDRYTLNGSIKVGRHFMSEAARGRKKRSATIKLKYWFQTMGHQGRKKRAAWSQHYWPKSEIVGNIIDIRQGRWTKGYGTDAVAQAMNGYKPVGSGLVIGSIYPWIEATALAFDAQSVLTSTYNILKSEHDKIETIHPLDLADKYDEYLDRFDWAASYSSIEHSGLGRYGDALDPEGDILEMQKVRCMLKDRGLFYFGVPFSYIDEVKWNVHRIYGPIRLAYMLAGFEIVAIYSFEPFSNGTTYTLKEVLDMVPKEEHALLQHLLVLRKTVL